MIYLDHAASTKVDPEVLEAMLPYFSTIFANPSSLYKPGQEAHHALNTARKQIAGFLHVNQNDILFTGGASESIATCLFSATHALKAKGNHIIISAIEHSSTLLVGKRLEDEGFDVTYLKPQKDGLFTAKMVEDALRADTILVSIMYVNNEIGTIQPIGEIGSMLEMKKIFFHTDASQAFPYLPCHIDELHVSAMTIVGYKFGAPKGIGLLYYAKDIPFISLIPGHQEFEMRGGTQNVPYIIGLAKAMEITERDREKNVKYITELRDYTLTRLQKFIPNIVVNGSMEARVSNNLSVAFLGTNGETLVIRLDLDGICVSQGSACTSDNKELSHVLMAIGVPEEEAVATLRITLGVENTKVDIDTFVARLAFHVGQIRHMNITY